jgi:hypothetical protein
MLSWMPCCCTTPTKQVHGALLQLRLPLHDLVRMDIALLRELREGPIAAQGRECHLGLEGDCVISRGRFIVCSPCRTGNSHVQ